MKIARSIKLFEEAQHLIPGGVNSPVRAFRSVGGQPRFIDRAKGARLYDLDGNTYIDYVLSWGPMILGHCHPKVVAAAREQVGTLIHGQYTTVMHPRLLELSERLESLMPGDIDTFFYASAGTESVESLPSGGYFDLAPVHILTTASLRRFRELAPECDFDSRRFRPNIVIETVPELSGFVESGWAGQALALGHVRLQVTAPCTRCVMTTLAQPGLTADPRVLRAVVAHNAAAVGVYATAARTPLIFRQIVGRFVRVVAGRGRDLSHVFLPADKLLRALFAKGVIDHPVAEGPIDFAAHAAVAAEHLVPQLLDRRRICFKNKIRRGRLYLRHLLLWLDPRCRICRRAAAHLRRERRDHTLQPTALVNEICLRLLGWDQARWQNRQHFFGVSAQLMRRVLVDIARRRNAERRGGSDAVRIPLDEVELAASEPDADLVAIDAALQQLAVEHPRKARVVELRFFGGLSTEETAQALDVSVRTVHNDWIFARAWLYRTLAESRTS